MTGAGGKVADVIEQFTNGDLEAVTKPDVEGHWV